MRKIVSLVILLAIFANVCNSTLTTTSQSGSISSSNLNNTVTKVYSGTNSTDAAIWDSYALSTPGTTGVYYTNVWFGPGSSNTTSYVYGVVTPAGSPSAFSKIYKRTLNATVVGWGNDTTEASVSATDSTISLTTPSGTSFSAAVGPGYFFLLSTGSDGTQAQVYINLVSGTSATQTKVTKNADVTTTCSGSSSTTDVVTTYTLGNAWYDIGSGAFFYTYNANVKSTPCTAGSPGTATYANTVYLGGLFLNGTVVWASPIGAAVTLGTGATVSATPMNIMGGGDNWLNASNIYVVYKDTTATTPTTYYSKTAFSTSASALGSFSSLIADTVIASPSTTTPSKTYVPAGVWASNYTYGIAVSYAYNTGATASSTYNFTNFLNGSTSGTDSGLTVSGATASGSLWGWQLSTGYTLAATFTTTTTTPATASYVLGTFYGNGTVNSTQVTLGALQGPVNVYEDLNGTQWIGWTDVDTTNSFTYNGYLAKLQGQLNVATSFGSALSTLMAFVALFLASILAF